MTTISIHFDDVRPMACGPLTAISHLVDADGWVRPEEVRAIADALVFLLDSFDDVMASSRGLDDVEIAGQGEGDRLFADARLNQTRAICDAASTLLCAIWGLFQVPDEAIREAGDVFASVVEAASVPAGEGD